MLILLPHFVLFRLVHKSVNASAIEIYSRGNIPDRRSLSPLELPSICNLIPHIPQFLSFQPYSHFSVSLFLSCITYSFPSPYLHPNLIVAPLSPIFLQYTHQSFCSHTLKESLLKMTKKLLVRGMLTC